MSDVYMHLTNYAINKRSENFIRDDDSGSKRRISSVMHCLQEKGYDVERIWIQIEDVIIKTLISCHPALRHNYASCFPHRTPDNSACFEILGFDVMLDYKLKPWLLEVNLSPSFHTDAPLDKDLKESLLCDALNLIPWHVMSKRKYAEQQRKLIEDRSINPRRSKMSVDDHRRMVEKLASHEERNMGHFRRVYPKDNYEELYLKYFQQSAPSLCAGTIASKARQTLIM
jgi:tubulin polyglutamylase TTLL6/13